jgi:hypothetical protein
MLIAVAGIIGWLLIAAIAMSLAAAAKRGDELSHAARRYLPDSSTGAQIIPFDRALARRNSKTPSVRVVPLSLGVSRTDTHARGRTGQATPR